MVINENIKTIQELNQVIEYLQKVKEEWEYADKAEKLNRIIESIRNAILSGSEVFLNKRKVLNIDFIGINGSDRENVHILLDEVHLTTDIVEMEEIAFPIDKINVQDFYDHVYIGPMKIGEYYER